jgi:elongation factor Ts
MAVTASQVKELRAKTGLGMMACKEALEETGGDLDAAVTRLRKQGQLKALAREGRATGEGLIAHYVHTGRRIGVLVEVNCETDFVARTQEFQTLAKELAMQVAATHPIAVSREDLPHEVVEREMSILREQAEATGKPAAVVDKIVQGRMEKFNEQACLLDQSYIRDPDMKVIELLTEYAARTGENVRVRRFVRFEVGEPLQSEVG